MSERFVDCFALIEDFVWRNRQIYLHSITMLKLTRRTSRAVTKTIFRSSKDVEKEKTYQCSIWIVRTIEKTHFHQLLCKTQILFHKPSLKDLTYSMADIWHMLGDLVWFDTVHSVTFCKLNHNGCHLSVNMSIGCWRKVLKIIYSPFKSNNRFHLTAKTSFFIESIMAVDDSITKLWPT